jgi:hypothetical protein
MLLVVNLIVLTYMNPIALHFYGKYCGPHYTKKPTWKYIEDIMVDVQYISTHNI